MLLANCIIRPWQPNAFVLDGESRFSMPLWRLVLSRVLVFSLFQLSHGGFNRIETQHLTWDKAKQSILPGKCRAAGIGTV